ncbi:hypothetical protein IQ238_26375 [Pleurocapsales cyanobacterium LEGE 06147]|nr:hypothetical protein [Pleurocapsales cyanobacterium LEGE 06147]
MAKRRNAKKEKAARNKVNARQFRKKSSYSSSRTRRFSSNDNKPLETEENNDKSGVEGKETSRRVSGSDE